MVGRAAVNSSQGGRNISYFFHGGKYAKISLDHNDKLIFGPQELVNQYWKSLQQAGFTSIDAILPIPGATNRAYFFSGSSYARVHFTPGVNQDILVGNKSSIDKWASLKKAGFERVDAALVVPGTTDQAYFFRGREFCRVSFKEGTGEHDALLEGPHYIREHWSNLGFDTIDTIIPSPTSIAHAYVFSDKLAATIILVPGGGVDVDDGPYQAAAHWKSLHQAGFY